MTTRIRGEGDGEHVCCESTAAIVMHIRRIAGTAINLGGHVQRPLALCGAPVAWDTRSPLGSATCRSCRALLPMTPSTRDIER